MIWKGTVKFTGPGPKRITPDMTVWVDADSCPATVRDSVAALTEERKIDVVYSANREIPVPRGNHIRFNISSREKESTDLFIMENVKKGDMVLTRDFLLAEKCLNIHIFCMNFDGRVFEKEWLEKRIEERNLMEVLYNSGSVKRYKKKDRSSSQNRAFSLSFSRELNNLILNK